MEQRARDALKVGDKLFSDKRNVDLLWQEIADNFYPERADFTNTHNIGDEHADHLFTSYPMLARRELGNMLAASLRPRSQKWFSIHVDDEELDERDAERRYLEYLTDIQWRAMYDSASGLVRATKQADHDFVTFGNAVIKFGPNIAGDGLLFRNYHLRDCAWSENAEGKIDHLHREWTPTARQLKAHFPTAISQQVERLCRQDPEKEVRCRHIVMPSRLYDYKSKGGKAFPYVSLFIEKDTETVLEEIGLNYFCYVVPRWHTVAGSVFGLSMATSILLPDGRTIQVIVRTIREAAEKHVDPPMIAVTDAIRGDIALYAGGITTADMEYDEKTGEVLRPVTQVKDGMPVGMELAAALREDIRSGFFLDKIQLPETGKDMTAFEVRRRIEEHIRSASPIFEPIEQEYSDPLCEGVFQVMRDHGAFPLDDMPETLSGTETHFSFRSPLSEMADQQEAETFLDVRDRILLPTAEIDPAQLEQVNWTAAMRDAMRASGWKQKWFNPIEMVDQRREKMAQQAAIQQGAAALAQAGQVAEQGGKGLEALGKAGIQ
jgi:hypothetical protein